MTRITPHHGPRPHAGLAPPPMPWTLGQLAMAQATTPYRPVFLTFLAMAYGLVAIVPTRPWPSQIGGDMAAGGGSLDTLLMLGMLGLSVVVLIERRHLALHLLARTWPLALTLAWFLVSVAWADYPTLTLKRTAFLIIGYIISLAIAAGARSPWHVLGLMMLTFQAVILVNMISLVVIPHLAMTDLGAAGMHGQKNIAGAVTMMGIVLGAFALFRARTRVAVMVALGTLVLFLAFLVLTRSKTSLGLVAIFVAFILPLAAGLSFGRALGLALILGAGLVATLFLFISGLMGWGTPDMLEVLVGDATFTARTDIWAFVWDHISRAPILGTGYGSFWDVGADNDPLRDARSWLAFVPLGVINQAHNGYLDILLQAGVPGLLGLLLVLGWTLVRAVRLMVSAQGQRDTWTAAGFAFSLILVLIVYNLMETALLSRVHLANQIFVLVVVLIERWGFPRHGPPPRPTAPIGRPTGSVKDAG